MDVGLHNQSLTFKPRSGDVITYRKDLTLADVCLNTKGLDAMPRSGDVIVYRRDLTWAQVEKLAMSRSDDEMSDFDQELQELLDDLGSDDDLEIAQAFWRSPCFHRG